jgi:hypothetical protein
MVTVLALLGSVDGTDRRTAEVPRMRCAPEK